MRRIAWTAVTTLVVTGITMAALAGGATAGTQETPEAKPPKPGTQLVGSAGGEMQWPGYEGHTVRFTFKAATPADGNPFEASGGFHVLHTTATGGPFGEFEGRVDCLAVGGKVAVVTGVITKGVIHADPSIEIIGKRVGFTVSDEGRRDRLGWSWALAGFESVPKCLGTAPFFATTTGNYRINGAMPF